MHFEIKTAPVLDNPEGGDICIYLKNGGETRGKCYGDTPNVPTRYGYVDPMEFLRDNQ